MIPDEKVSRMSGDQSKLGEEDGAYARPSDRSETDLSTDLHVDDPSYVAAAHFQNHRVPADEACYACHTDYVFYGGLRAKMRGLRHIYVQSEKQSSFLHQRRMPRYGSQYPPAGSRKVLEAKLVNLLSLGIARALRIAGVLLVVGLGVDVISLVWERPLAFLLFAGIRMLADS